MKDTLISFHTAKRAKKKGFDTYNDSYTTSGELIPLRLQAQKIEECVYPAPTQSLLQKWLREKHNLHIWILPYGSNDQYNVFVNRGFNLDLVKDCNLGPVNTYEQALEVGLQDALNYIQ